LDCVETVFRIILIDNYSVPEDFKVLMEYVKTTTQAQLVLTSIDEFDFDFHSRIILVKGSSNVGFAAGNNLGIRIAQKQKDFDGVVLLNNDTIVHPKFLDEILNYKDLNAEANLIGGRIFLYGKRDTIWYDGGKLNKSILRATHINQNKKISQISSNKTPNKTQFITGCLLYISKSCLNNIGLLNESLFMYCEDLEYCLRAKNNGLLLVQVPTSIIWHKVGASSSKKTSSFAAYWGARNRIRVSQLHQKFWGKLLTLSFFVATRIPRFFIWLLNGNSGNIKAQIKGIADGLSSSETDLYESKYK
jgi:GT2 family glycosyltransferase